MHSLFGTLRFTFRSLRKSRVFVVVAVLTIALGTSATTTVFSWIEALLLNPLSGVEDESRLAVLETTEQGKYYDTSYPDYKDFSERAKSLSGVAAFRDAKIAMRHGDQSEWVSAELVSGNFFDVLGVRPSLGRFFAGEERKDIPDGAAVAVISQRLWKNSFHSDPGVIGKTVKFNGYPFSVIGVASKSFKGSIVGAEFDVYLPIMMQKEVNLGDWLYNRSVRAFHPIVRLAPGRNLAIANGEARMIAQQLARSFPLEDDDLSAELLPLREASYGAQSILKSVLGILMGSSVIVLLIVCSNVANLLLIRAASREREMAIRLALGASRGRIVGQLLFESLVISLLGTLLGILFTLAAKDSLRYLVPPTEKPFSLNATIDGRVLAFSAGVAILAALLSAVAPALRAAKTSLSSVLNQGGRGGSAARSKIREAFVISAIAFGLIATSGAGMFLKSFYSAKRTEIGFDPSHVLLVGLDLSQDQLGEKQGLAFFDRLRQEILTMPGVQGACYGNDVPLGFGDGTWNLISVPGYQPAHGESVKVYRNIVSPGYFKLLRIPVLQGRDFTEADGSGSNVIIVNQAFVNQYLSTGFPLGRTVQIGDQPVSIVGVVADLKYRSLQEHPKPYMYYPLRDSYRPGMALHIKTAGDSRVLLPEVERRIKKVDPNISVFVSMPMESYIGASFYSKKLAAIVLGILGGIGLILATMGVYGVTSYSVSQRTREIGIRMALGAQRLQIVGLLLRRVLGLTIAGIGLGLFVTFALCRLAASQLMADSAGIDVFSLVFASLLMAMVAISACFLPAWNATRINPVQALRYE